MLALMRVLCALYLMLCFQPMEDLSSRVPPQGYKVPGAHIASVRIQETLNKLEKWGLLVVAEIPAEGLVWMPLGDVLTTALRDQGLAWGVHDTLTNDTYERAPYRLLRTAVRAAQNSPGSYALHLDEAPQHQITADHLKHTLSAKSKLVNPYHRGRYGGLSLIFVST